MHYSSAGLSAQDDKQWFGYSGKIGLVTLKITWFYYHQNIFWIKVSQKCFFILKKEALMIKSFQDAV